MRFMQYNRYRIFLFLLLLLSVLTVGFGCAVFPQEAQPVRLQSRNVILIIGDGMGPEQVKAAGYYQYGIDGKLSFETFPYQTEMTTYSQNFFVTDSAASATAMATGEKVFNDVISLDIPGNREPLLTLLEIAASEGRRTGLVTTATITHATPAAFAAHTEDRQNYKEIGAQYMAFSRPDVLLGGGDTFLTVETAREARYVTVETREELLALEPGKEPVLGYFGSGYMPYMYDGMGDLPELSDMAMKAIDLLETEEKGFFLMIEAARIDHAGHANDLARNIQEVLELSDTVEQVSRWAEGREDTVIIVTADHETGGLTILRNNGAGALPDVRWRTTGHTWTKVPVYLWGEGAGHLAATIRDNTDIFEGLTAY